ncbi:MAG TPA: ribonuclease E/G, partial [Paracoccaceae bacterium]|nr:ribonuclease E/G [Paracoccaceae bacterium]
ADRHGHADIIREPVVTGTLVLARLHRGPELAALIENGRVADWVWDPARGPQPETRYKAKVERPVPGAGAVFVSLGEAGQGYLRDARGLRPGSVILVESTSIPEPGKAIPVSPRVLYRERYTIHTPGAAGVNVARGIAAEAERARLAGIVEGHVAAMEDWLGRMADVRDPADVARIRRVVEAHRTGGTILRTAAQGQPAERITADLDLATAARLVAEDALSDADTPLGPVGQPPLPRDYAFREWGDRIGRVVVGPGDFDALDALERRRQSPFLDRLERMRGDPLDHHGVWDELERMRELRTDLPSGGWISVEATRAMVAVDVNTAGELSTGAGVTANVEAARELPRQLRLRGLGGQIAIDFAPLKKTDRRRIEDTLKSAFRRDPVETTLAGWTPLGNFELQRKRERRPVAELLAWLDREGAATR